MIPQPVRDNPLRAQTAPAACAAASLAGAEARQPATFRLGRDHAPAATAQCAAERTLEGELSSKHKACREALAFSGRTGDMSVQHGTPDRAEDAWAFFGTPVDTPTFARFAAAVSAKGGSKASVRRAAGVRRATAAARAREAADVAALSAWEDARFAARVAKK
jgi:hypothetical protein